VTRLQPGVQILIKARDFCLLKNVQTGSGTHTDSCSFGIEVLSGA